MHISKLVIFFIVCDLLSYVPSRSYYLRNRGTYAVFLLHFSSFVAITPDLTQIEGS
jgi:hypothetical protein